MLSGGRCCRIDHERDHVWNVSTGCQCDLGHARAGDMGPATCRLGVRRERTCRCAPRARTLPTTTPTGGPSPADHAVLHLHDVRPASPEAESGESFWAEILSLREPLRHASPVRAGGHVDADERPHHRRLPVLDLGTSPRAELAFQGPVEDLQLPCRAPTLVRAGAATSVRGDPRAGGAASAQSACTTVLSRGVHTHEGQLGGKAVAACGPPSDQ